MTSLKKRKIMLQKISLEQIKADLQISQINTTALSTPLTIDFYNRWIRQGYFAGMNYLAEHLTTKNDPQKIHPNLKSALVVSFEYYPTSHPIDKNLPVRTALYSKNKDYHFWVKDKLNILIKSIQDLYPEEVLLPFVDSGPILERDLAYKAGLGWFGKNTCLIHPQKGSLFFISEILTSLPIDKLNHIFDLPTKTQEQFIPDFCGKCTKCIDICPTQAIEEPRLLNAEKCISYLTIESKTTPPVELRKSMSDWFFGCDLCQTVCPWNLKFIKSHQLPPVSNEKQISLNSAESQEQIAFFKMLLNSSNKKIQKEFSGSPLFRSGGFGLKRNALIVIANKKMIELKPDVEKLLNDPKLSELAQWCLLHLNGV